MRRKQEETRRGGKPEISLWKGVMTREEEEEDEY